MEIYSNENLFQPELKYFYRLYVKTQPVCPDWIKIFSDFITSYNFAISFYLRKFVSTRK